jgi:uncharacterized small protein (DUF1192 family)
MRKFMIALAVSGAALVAATPAAAQYYPQPQYGAPYGNAYGHNNGGFRNVRALQVRVDRIQRDLVRLARVRAISPNEFNNREGEARDIEHRLRRDARDGRGLNGREVFEIERRIARLEQRIARDTRDGNRFGYNGFNGQYVDRDRDGRNDRYEDDRGWRRD